jgi:nucleotide sugar dehydrogenase
MAEKRANQSTKKRADQKENFSISPDGEAFPLPRPEDYQKEFKRLQKIVAAQRKEGREIVVVMGLGFVGAVMAGVVADSVQKPNQTEADGVMNRQGNVTLSSSKGMVRQGNVTLSLSKGMVRQAHHDTLCHPELVEGPLPRFPKFVIGVQRPSVRSYWKIPLLNRGIAPVEAEDPEVAPMIARCVKEKKTLIATYTEDALCLADVVVVDVQCDYFKETLGNCRQGHAEIKALEDSLKIIGEKIKPDCLVLIETTVPPGTTEYVAYPILKKAFERRFSTPNNKKVTNNPSPTTVTLSSSKGVKGGGASSYEPLLSHSYERVMPGREYVASIRDFWRVCSGINEEARKRVAKFLSEVLNVEKYPLTVLDRPVESETCKIVENSYRATILAFLNEWSLFAERNGVDLIKVIKAIKVRPTHSNMIFPGPGIGGYCLPKDGGLGVWAYQKLMGFEDDIFKITPLAIDINDTRSLHAAELVRDALRNMGKIVAASRIAVLGASYREDVGDTRYSGSEILVRKLTEMGGDVVVHDPYVKHWWELEKQDTYPAPGHSWARFFRNQEKLSETRIQPNLTSALKGVDAVVLAVKHQAYLKLTPDEIIKMTKRPVAIIDCFGILSDEKIRRFFELDCEVKGLGRGHVKRIKDQVKG